MSYTNGLDDPTLYFNTKLYTGNGGTQSITGVGFQPDWVWIKSRSDALSHALFDSIRGTTKVLNSNATTAEYTNTDTLTAFGTDGFTVGSNTGVNASGETRVAWNWLGANGTASNTDGSITSTVSANTTSGFSIVSYTGTGSAGTIGHGLSATPKMIIAKNRSDGGQFWAVYHASLSGANKYLSLNSTSSEQGGTAIWNSTHPTSSVFSVAGHGTTNENGDNIIAYCFAEKQGYSKFGSYVGNGSTDGTFIYTGFKPAFVMNKKYGAGGADGWKMIDNKRNPHNVVNANVSAEKSDAEATNQVACDFLSNGFKWRSANGGENASTQEYIYMAFAESPFTTSTGIPTTAR